MPSSYVLLIVLITALCLIISEVTSQRNADGPLLTCYADINQPRPVSLIDPSLCTHVLVIGGCSFNANGSLSFPPVEAMAEYVKLKEQVKNDTGLRVLLTLLPQNHIISEVVLDEVLMDAMMDDLALYIEQNQLDGFDYDWEFPAWSDDAKPSDRSGFVRLLEKTRTKFDSMPTQPLLFVTVAAPYTIATAAYDVDGLARYADYVQVMAYDFHRFNKVVPFTGFNAPLHALGTEFWLLKRMNSDYSVRNWLSRGLPREQLVLGIPTYGIGFTLASPRDHLPYSPAVDVSHLLGDAFSYNSVCDLIGRNQTTSDGWNWTSVWEEHASTTYAFAGSEWLAFEDVGSVQAKARYAVKEMGLAGVMVFAFHQDDYLGKCISTGRVKYPLIRAVRAVLDEERQRRKYDDPSARNGRWGSRA